MTKSLIFLFVTILYNPVLYSQTEIAYSDSVYGNINTYELSQFEDIYIPNHPFLNPTLDLDLNFQPTNDLSIFNSFGNYAIKGKVKKVTKFKKYEYSDHKKLDSYTVFNTDGLKTMTNESGYIESYFYYNEKNQMIRWERIVNNDTLYIKEFSYNSRNQLIKSDKTQFRENGTSIKSSWIIAYDLQNKPIALKYAYANGQLDVIKNITYDHNIVKIESLNNGKSIGTKELVFSSNSHLIKSKFSNYTIFYSYNEKGQCVKEIVFINDIINNIRTKIFDENGSQTKSIFEEPNSDKKEIHFTTFKYDRFNNKTYEYSSDNVTKNTYEFFYEVEYF